MGNNNSNLQTAKNIKDDEFYTTYEAIEKELQHYLKHFRGKVVLCNCDDPFKSNFCRYFVRNFNKLGLKRLICTSYVASEGSLTQTSLFDCNQIFTAETHGRVLDLKKIPSKAIVFTDDDIENGMIDHYPQTVGLDIQIDVLGIIVKGGKSAIAFIEAKKTQLNLHDLGQLWAYCKLCDPAEAFLLSSAGIGSLNKILNNLSRTDLLDFGDGRKIKKMQVAKWDITSNSIDFRTLVPRI